MAGYGGHGIGTEMHMDPHILNYGTPGQGPAARRPAWRWPSSRWSRWARRATQELDDGWTVVTADGSRAAHWEHTVAILADGPWVLTAAGRRPRGAPAPRRRP